MWSHGNVPRFGLALNDTVEALVLDLLEWLRSSRPYAEVLDVWRTSCPRLPVWEDANDRGFVTHIRTNGRAMVAISPAGREFLDHWH